MTGHIFSCVILGIWEQALHRLRSWEADWDHIPWLCQLVWVITAARDLRVTIYHLSISHNLEYQSVDVNDTREEILNKIWCGEREIFWPCSVTNSVMESRLGSDIMGWVESHICTRVPFHPWQRLNTVTLQYKGNINWGKHSNLLSPALITAHIFSHCNIVTHPHSHSQALAQYYQLNAFKYIRGY